MGKSWGTMLEWDFSEDLKDSKVDENGNAVLGFCSMWARQHGSTQARLSVKDWHGTKGVYALNLGKRLVSPALLSLFHLCFCDKIPNQKKFREGNCIALQFQAVLSHQGKTKSGTQSMGLHDIHGQEQKEMKALIMPAWLTLHSQLFSLIVQDTKVGNCPTHNGLGLST